MSLSTVKLQNFIRAQAIHGSIYRKNRTIIGPTDTEFFVVGIPFRALKNIEIEYQQLNTENSARFKSAVHHHSVIYGHACLVDRSIGRSIDGLIDWLVGRLVSQSVLNNA